MDSVTHYKGVVDDLSVIMGIKYILELLKSSSFI